MDIKTDMLVRVALKNGLVSEEAIAAAIQEQNALRESGKPSRLGDILIEKGLIDLDKARQFLRNKADTRDAGRVQYEELDASLQADEKDCLSDFEDFDDLASNEFTAAPSPEPAAEKAAAPAAAEPEKNAPAGPQETPAPAPAAPAGTAAPVPLRTSVLPSLAAAGEEKKAPPAAAEPADPMQGKMFGDYRIIQRLGSDVAGDTYRAVFLRECRVVTLRVLKMGSLANNQAAADKFIATVRRAYQLEHPKIQRILSAGQNEQQLYYAAEYFAGNSLRRELLQKNSLTAAETITMALSVADALAYAHSKKVFHTQIDPSKIIIGTDGNIKLLGFGLGIEVSENLDWLAESLGDLPYYVAPEMTSDGEARKFIGAVTDLYSLGAVMFHCLTGTPPFHGETLDEIMLDIYQEEDLHQRLYASGTVPPELAELVLQLLNPEPLKRISSAAELIKRLHAITGEPAAGTVAAAPSPRSGVSGRFPAPAAPASTAPLPHTNAKRDGRKGRRSAAAGIRSSKKNDERNSMVLIYGALAFVVLLLIIVCINHSRQAQISRRNAIIAKEAAAKAAAEQAEIESKAKAEKAVAAKAKPKSADKKKKSPARAAAAKTAVREDTAGETAAAAEPETAETAEEEIVEEIIAAPAEEEPSETEATEQKATRKRGLFGSLDGGD